MTQNNLGIALEMLGERESSTTHLEEAVDAYRAALQEYTRERVPLKWAMTQNNLGIALKELGTRESGTALLGQAIDAYRMALHEYTRERVPLDWAMTQNNLGLALEALGTRESGTAHLEQAIDAYRTALQEDTRERVPLDWAMTQNNLGIASRELAARRSLRPCQAVAYHWSALQLLRTVAPANVEIVRRQLERDMQASPAATATGCPKVPAAAWSVLVPRTASTHSP
jgi:tetratricopeptide (TPR) repeat protein